MDDDHGGTIVGRYLRYKIGTEKIVNWLADTAAQHCDLRDILDCLKDGPTSRDRKAAAPARGGKATSLLHSSTTIRVKTRELLSLAKNIAAAKKSTVPAGILKILGDVIDGRQSCADWYASQTSEGDTDLASQNESHIHFISILQEVQQHLDGLQVTPGSEIAPSKTTKGKKKKQNTLDKAAKSTDELRNLFEYLDVEEPSASPLGETGPCKSDAGLKKPNYKLEDDKETDIFALWCHLKDMSDTRLFIRELWLEYRRGDVTIEVAGTVTDIAIGMIGRAHDEFVKDHDLFDHYGDTMDFLKLRTCFNNNAICVLPNGTNALAEHFTSSTKPTDLLCPSAAMLLRAFQDTTVNYFEDAEDNYIKAGHQYARTEVRPSIFPHPMTAFEPRLLSLVPELCAIKSLNEGMLKRTTFSKLLSPLIGIPGYMGQPMSAVFACQICMDINELVDFDSSCGGDAVLRTVPQVTATIDAMVNFFKHRPNFVNHKPDWMSIGGEALENRDAIEHARMLEQQQTKSKMTGEDRLAHHKIKCRNPTLDALPHNAGTSSYSLRFQLFNQSAVLANENTVMILLAHFYKAAHKYGLVTAVWHDLDFLVAQNSSKKPLITKTSASSLDPYAMLKHYLMDIGQLSMTHTNGTVPTLPAVHALPNAKKINGGHSALVSGMRERHRENLKRGTPSGEDLVEAVLTSMAAKSQRGSQSTKIQQFSPTQLLAIFKASLIADEPRINFAYWDFTEMCLKLLSRLTIVVQLEKMPCTYAFEGIYYLLRTAAEAQVKGHSIQNTAFGRAAIVMQHDLESMNTRKFSQAALDASSGRIPKDQRPKFSNKDFGTEPELEKLLQKYPDISVGTPRDTFEFYDPAGSMEKFSDMLGDDLMDKFMPNGSTNIIHATTDWGDWENFKDAEGHETGTVRIDMPKRK